MKILVLGNGFDIDHNLPTSYMDFLRFCNAVLELDNPESVASNKLKESQRAYIQKLREHKEAEETFRSLLKNDHLLYYLNCQIDRQGTNWIDFEGELRTIVQVYRSIELALKQSTQYYKPDSDHKIRQVLQDLNLDAMEPDQWDEIKLQDLRKKIYRSLERFSQALEHYISLFINETEVVGVCPDVVDFDATKVLTFNYSTTYERTYGGLRWKESVDHIHGIASAPSGEDTSIILGITTEGGALESSFVEVEKYYQRITKRTGSEYKQWLQSKSGKNEKIEVMFFGHSLDPTDRDVITDLINNENSEVKIYYFDTTAHKQIVANLITILGKECLIKYVSGKEPKIRFIKQRPHTKEDTAGIEITKDTLSLYSMYMMSQASIEEFLNKIERKIKSNDLDYFYSQRKLVSLFEALYKLGIEIFTLEHAAELSESLPFETTPSGQLIDLEPEEWTGYSSWGEEYPCSAKTNTLIELINKANRESLAAEKREKCYARVLQCVNGEAIKKELIKLLTEAEPNSQFWNEIYELIRIMYNNKQFVDALAMLKNETQPFFLMTRITHLIDVYWEYVFEVNYNKQMAESYVEEQEHHSI